MLLMLLLFILTIISGEAAAGLSPMGEGSSLDSFEGRGGCREYSRRGCLLAGGEEEELLMDSEINRRILVETTKSSENYLGYEALKRGSTQCKERGAPYSNCRPGAQKNLYYRGCSRNTGCYRDSS